MLQFVFGRAGTGKTHTVIEKIKETALKGEKALLLVPEQFSFESERAVLKALGDKKASEVEVLSFTRLCDEVERLIGGNTAKTVTDSSKIILMTRAIKECKENLLLWKGYTSSSAFAESLLATVTELKYNAVYPEDLKDASARSKDGYLAKKLHDLSEIFFRYNSLTAERFIDPDDRLDRLYKSLETTRYFENKTVFIDSFKTFSGQQFKILKRIISQAKNITVCLLNDPECKNPMGIFSSVQKTQQKIRLIAKNMAVEIADDIILKDFHFNNPYMKTVESLMSAGNEKTENSNGITVCRASNRYFETDFVARNIRRIVKEKNARYSDFVIIARDPSMYEDALISSCEKNGVYCFIDRKIPLSSLPMAVAVLSALKTARQFSTENILRFHKSGISVLTSEEISLLENYTYLWNIEGSLWNKEWNMNPKGFTNFEVFSDKDKAELDKINELRLRAITPLIKFKSAFKGNAESYILAIMNLLSECKAEESFKKLWNDYKENGNRIFADAFLKGWEELMDIFDSISKCYSSSEITANDFCDALRLSIEKTTVGVIPQMIDEVIFGDAERIRPSRPKYAFILGANQGIFPKTVASTGIFSRLERNRLRELDIDIPDRTIEGCSEEELLVYSNTCCATDELYVSYSLSSDSGEDLEPSAFVSKLIEGTGCKTVCEPSKLCEENLPQTKESAFSEFCSRFSYDKDDAYTAIEPILNDQSIVLRKDAVISSSKAPKINITPDTATALFGRKISMSASKFDDFSRCRFSYFCKDGLGIKKLQPAVFDNMQRGSLIHYVLDRIVSKYKKEIKNLSNGEIVREVNAQTEEYLDSIVGYRSIETPRLKYLVSTMKRSLYRVVERIRDEFKQSEFEPIHCELKIGLGGDMKDIEIPLEDGAVLSLNGVVDRIDGWNGYIRIVDYKTGSRTFKLPDVLFGQNMQMLLYLYSLVKTGSFGKKSAGILYMPAKRNLGKDKASKRMNGLLVSNTEVISAMEKENSGEFVPKLSEKNPSSSFIKEEDFDTLFEFITKKLQNSGNKILSGEISPNPIDGLDSGACKYCDFGAICRIKNEKHQAVPRLSNNQIMEEMRKEE